MAKRILAWVLLIAASAATLGYGGAGGIAAQTSGDAQKAYGIGGALADRGDVGAKCDPGLMYRKGCGMAKDDAALMWDRLAANQDGSIADEVTVSTARASDGKAIQVGVALALPIKHEVVWEVLNDYENMPRFVPDILATRLISVGPGRKRVEIKGVARLLFVEYPTAQPWMWCIPPMDPLPSIRWQATWPSTVSCGYMATEHTPGSIIRSGSHRISGCRR